MVAVLFGSRHPAKSIVSLDRPIMSRKQCAHLFVLAATCPWCALRLGAQYELAGDHERALELLERAAVLFGRESSDRRPKLRVTVLFPLESDTAS